MGSSAFGKRVAAPGAVVALLAGALVGAGPAAQVTGTPIYPAASIAATSGNSQTAAPSGAFPTALQATVTDASGHPVPGAAVTFTVASGSASFPGGSTATATTNAQGIATAPTLTAGATSGAVEVTASTPAGSGTAQTMFMESVVTDGPARADLSVALDTPASLAHGGASGTITIRVTNNGPSTAIGVLTGAYVPPALSVITTSGGTVTHGLVLFQTPSIAAHATVTYTVTVATGAQKGRFPVLVATASGTRDSQPLNNLNAAILTSPRQPDRYVVRTVPHACPASLSAGGASVVKESRSYVGDTGIEPVTPAV
jgi:Bacterial Ig-like domain (group 1)/Domain of unknown function DUF11